MSGGVYPQAYAQIVARDQNRVVAHGRVLRRARGGWPKDPTPQTDPTRLSPRLTVPWAGSPGFATQSVLFLLPLAASSAVGSALSWAHPVPGGLQRAPGDGIWSATCLTGTGARQGRFGFTLQ